MLTTDINAWKPVNNSSFVFFDNFTGGSLDSGKWVNGKYPGGGDYELPEPRYIDTLFRTALASVDNRTLALQSYTNNRTGSQVETKNTFGYGSYRASIKIQPCADLEVFDAFFSLSYPQNGADEIDVEIRRDINGDAKLQLQTYYMPSSGGSMQGHEQDYPISFDPADGNYHIYGYDWYSDHIDWFVDGKLIATSINSSDTPIPTEPMNIYFQNWITVNAPYNLMNGGQTVMYVNWVTYSPDYVVPGPPNETGLLPVASFTSNVTGGMVPLAVQFNDTSAWNPMSWQWSFGDGSAIETARNVTHIFTSAGTFNVTLIASNANGSSTMMKEGYITVIPDNHTSFTLSLKQGWNLVSSPFVVDPPINSSAFKGTNITLVAQYNQTTGGFDIYRVGKTPTAFPFESGQGYFLYCDNNTSYTVNGYNESGQSAIIYPGWNLIGWTNMTGSNAKLLVSKSQNVTMLARYNTTSGNYDIYRVGKTPTPFSVQAGEGYFLYTAYASPQELAMG